MRPFKMMKFLAVTIALVTCLVGCSDFATEKDELAYLSTIANPTPRQWTRRKELEKADEARQKTQGIEAERLMRNDMRIRSAKQAERAKQDVVDAAALMAKGEEHERKSEPKLARVCYHDVLTNYPETPQAAVAADRLKTVGVK